MRPLPAVQSNPAIIATATRVCDRRGQTVPWQRRVAASAILFVPFLGSCAYVLSQGQHAFMRGTVVRKLDEHRAQVCLGDGEVRVGDRIVLFENDCRMPTPARRESSIFPGADALGGCERIELGSGVIERLLNQHYSVARFPDGVAVRVGATVDVP